jgi:hypothetical protein
MIAFLRAVAGARPTRDPLISSVAPPADADGSRRANANPDDGGGTACTGDATFTLGWNYRREQSNRDFP